MTLSGQDIGMARTAANARLEDLLAHAGTDDLVLIRTAARGYVGADGEVRLTEAGAAAYQRWSAEAAKLTTDVLYAGIDPADRERWLGPIPTSYIGADTAGRVMRAVTRNANGR